VNEVKLYFGSSISSTPDVMVMLAYLFLELVAFLPQV